MKQKKSAKVLAVVSLCLSLIASTAVSASAATNYTTQSNKAYNWLKAQQKSSGLVDSFESDPSDVAYIYDQAVAVMAFLINNDTVNAKRVLTELQALQNSDGSWYTAYYGNSGGVPDYNNKNVGPIMWVALAVMKYGIKTGDTTFSNMAVKAVNWCLQFQQADGGINGGVYNNGNVMWASCEYNEEAYAALLYWGFSPQAAQVKSFLDNVAWNDSTGYFYVGRNDPTDMMDVNPWGVLSLGTSGTHQYDRDLTYVMNNHRSSQSANGITVDAFDFDSDKDDVWFEGTAFMVDAFKQDGQTANADYFLRQIIKAQGANGGIPYSLKGTYNGYWTMSSAHAVSSTGWFIIANAGMNPFDTSGF